MERVVSMLLALALGNLTNAQDAFSVRGMVVDEKGAPLGNVAVEGIEQHAVSTFVTGDAQPLARSKDDGTFEFVVAPGKFTPHLLALHAPGRGTVMVGGSYQDLAPIVLPKAHRIAGRLRLPNGDAAAGVRVEVRDWLSLVGFLPGRSSAIALAAEPWSATRTGADGRFVIDCAADTCLGVRIGGGAIRIQDLGPVANDAPLDLVVQPVPMRTVLVLDPDGKPVANAIVSCSNRSARAWPQEDHARTNVDGTCTLPLVPDSDWLAAYTEDHRFRAWSQVDSSSTRCEVRLEAVVVAVAPNDASPTTQVVSGTFVDPDSGEPLADAIVWAVEGKQANFDPHNLDHRYCDGAAPNGARQCRTRADGTFTLHVEPGNWWIGAKENAQGRRWHWLGTARNPMPRECKVGNDGVRDLHLTLQPTMAVRGRLDGGMPRGTHVRCIPDSRWAMSSGEYLAYQPRTTVQADGTFTALHQQTGATRIELLLPRLFRQGPHDRVLLDVRQLAEATPMQFDATPFRPALVRGRLHTDIPPARLAVVSMARTDPKGTQYGMAWYSGPVAAVARDRSFVLREPPGTRTLVVVDTMTGVMLHREQAREVSPNGDSTCELKVASHRVEITFTGLPDVDTLWLQPRLLRKNRPIDLGQMTDTEDRGTGCHVAADCTRLDVWLPAGAATLDLIRDRQHQDERVIASVKVDAGAGRHDKVILKVD